MCREMFDALDKDKSGNLNLQEFGSVSVTLMTRLGLNRQDALSAREAMSGVIFGMAYASQGLEIPLSLLPARSKPRLPSGE